MQGAPRLGCLSLCWLFDPVLFSTLRPSVQTATDCTVNPQYASQTIILFFARHRFDLYSLLGSGSM